MVSDGVREAMWNRECTQQVFEHEHRCLGGDFWYWLLDDDLDPAAMGKPQSDRPLHGASAGSSCAATITPIHETTEGET